MEYDPKKYDTKDTFKPSTPEELFALASATANVTFSVANREITLPVRCLRPDETATLQAMLDKVRPPLKEVEGKADPVLDEQDEDYLRRSGEMQRRVRALALWWACPMLRSAKVEALPESERPDAIVKHIQSVMTHRSLDKIYQVVVADCSLRQDAEAQLGVLVSFTSPAS